MQRCRHRTLVIDWIELPEETTAGESGGRLSMMRSFVGTSEKGRKYETNELPFSEQKTKKDRWKVKSWRVRTEVDEAVGNVEARLEASSLYGGSNRGRVWPRRRHDEERIGTTALRYELNVHALTSRVDSHACPLTAVRADRLAGVGSTVVDAYIVERTTVQRIP